MRALSPRVPPVAQFLAAAALMGLVAAVSPIGGFAFTGQLMLASMLLLAAGLVGMAAVRVFARAGTTVNPLRPESASRLVAHGVYRYTRNPMYLALLLALIAWGIWLGNAAALLLVPLFMLTIEQLQIRPEEQALEALFGAEFVAYKQRVRRWL
jgi:protein-S-isoprenylcysteine O-methyltransferase Ste14